VKWFLTGQAPSTTRINLMNNVSRAVFMRVFARLGPDIGSWPEGHPTAVQLDNFLDKILNGEIGEEEMGKVLLQSTLFRSNNGVPVTS